MTKPDKDEAGYLQSLTEPAVRNYVLIGLIALALYHAQMMERANETASLMTLFIAGAGLIFRWVISPALFLIMLTYMLIDPNFSGLQRWLAGVKNPYFMPGRFHGRGAWQEALLGASVLVYLIAQYRVLSFTQQSMPDDPPPRRKGEPEPAKPRRPLTHFADRELIVAAFFSLGAIIVGFAAWELFSTYERQERPGSAWGIERTFARVMLFLWSIGTIIVLTGVVFRHRALRRMSRQQARLMLQDMFWQETRREQERIYRWRRWARRRDSKKGTRSRVDHSMEN